MLILQRNNIKIFKIIHKVIEKVFCFINYIKWQIKTTSNKSKTETRKKEMKNEIIIKI